MERQKRILAFMIGFMFFMVFPTVTDAEEFTVPKNGLEIIFVMDYSGSMKTNDSQDMAKEMVKAFIDTVYGDNIKVGFVAYNDRILSSTAPVGVSAFEDREALKKLIDGGGYFGNTDIGLGLRHAYELFDKDNGEKKILVLISDGESDLTGSETGRDIEISIADLNYTEAACCQSGIPVYTVAFGQYEGNAQALAQLSQATGAEMYMAEGPERLIEILYGIFSTKVDFDIRKVADGIYASGSQDIHIRLKEPYLDEINLLIISRQPVGESSILYGEQVITPVNLRNYTVGKIVNVSDDETELVLRTETIKDQELQIYLVNYRTLTPILEINATAYKNTCQSIRIYFRDREGMPIIDETFYKKIFCQSVIRRENSIGETVIPLRVTREGIQGEAYVAASGKYYVQACLNDGMRNEVFEPVEITVLNHPPEGGLPEIKDKAIVSKENTYRLADFFNDSDGEELIYSVDKGTDEGVEANIREGVLTIKAKRPGVHTISLTVSDGEDSLVYEYHLDAVCWWLEYWWVAIIFIAVFLGIGIWIWRLLQKPQSQVKTLIENNTQNHFCGKLDAYFTIQPESEEEIPPRSFDMYRINENKIAIGTLLKEYPEAVDKLELDEIYLIADEERRMILCHMSQATVMIGNTIACKKVPYSLRFGDVIYITSLEGTYDLEIHYISLIR